MSAFTRWTSSLALLAVLACAGFGQAQVPSGAEGQDAKPSDAKPARVESGKSRWQRMSPEERARVAQLYEEYRGLPEAERERMRAHLERMAEVRREIEARIPDELRAKLEALAPEQRREVLREYIGSAIGERAERLREKLPPELLSELEGATPARRVELLSDPRAPWREQGAERALGYLARQLQLPPEEVERIRALPPEQKFAAIADLGRRDMERRGPPAGVDPQEFRRWLELPPRECFERMRGQGLRGEPGEPGGHERGAGRGPRGEFGPPEGRGGWPGARPDGHQEGRPQGRPEGRPEGRTGEGGERPRPPRREGRLAPEAQTQVYRALWPDKEWIVELAGETRDARRQEIERRVRERVDALLRAQPGLEAAELDRLRTLQGREYLDALRDIAGDPRPRWGERRRHDRPRDGPPGPPPPEQR